MVISFFLRIDYNDNNNDDDDDDGRENSNDIKLSNDVFF
jgi:hypothetical protein